MYKNQYGAVIDKSKIDLIAARARRLGFRRQDIDDAQQQIAMELIDFVYDPEKSNGASEETAITSLIDHQLLTMRRSKQRYSQRVSGSENIPSNVEAAISGLTEVRRIHLKADMERAAAQLSPMAREICDGLAEGQSTNEISQRLGIGWHTVRRHIDEIRQRFERLGVDASII